MPFWIATCGLAAGLHDEPGAGVEAADVAASVEVHVVFDDAAGLGTYADAKAALATSRHGIGVFIFGGCFLGRKMQSPGQK